MRIRDSTSGWPQTLNSFPEIHQEDTDPLQKLGKIIRRVTQLKFLHPENQMQDSGSQFGHLEDSFKQRSLGRFQNVIQEVLGVLWASAFLPSP